MMPRLLVADDDSSIRQLLRQCLERGGYDVEEAQDGAQAIAAVHSSAGQFDVVITDYAMPGASGLDVIAEIHRLDPNVPCVIVTALHDLDLAMRAMAAGAVGFLPKPFKPDHLLAIVARALERRQLSLEAMRLGVLAPMLERFTMLLANTLEAKDLPTHNHCERLVALSDRLAVQMGLSAQERAEVRLGACLHDIGKVAIPETLLTKAQALTEDEWVLMRTHPDVGATILQDVEIWVGPRLIVRHHHEKFDGTGYPDGLRGIHIPLGARIVALADAYDVMRAGRPYSPSRSLDEAVSEVQRCSGTHFDPECVRVFLEACTASDHLLLDVHSDTEEKSRNVAPDPEDIFRLALGNSAA